MEFVLDYHQRLNADRRWAWEEGDAYFQGESQVFVAYRAVEERLKEAEIRYALAGVLAMFQHGYRRFSTDVEFWIAPGDWPAIEVQFLGNGYLRIGSSTIIRCERTGVTLIFSLCEKLSDSTEIIDDIPTVTLAALIESKLILGRAPWRLSALSDVQELIRVIDLPAGFAERLDASVQTEYLNKWREVRSAPPGARADRRAAGRPRRRG